jgi:hypothetical protein
MRNAGKGKKFGKVNVNFENYSLLLTQAKKIYETAILRFPTCTLLRINYAYFLLDKMNNKKNAMKELVEAEKLKPSFDQQFIIYRYKYFSFF